MRDWLGIAEGLVSILRDWPKYGDVFVWVFGQLARDWSVTTLAKEIFEGERTRIGVEASAAVPLGPSCTLSRILRPASTLEFYNALPLN